MKNTPCTIIRFDCGGYYSNNGDDVEWNPKEDNIYTLVIKGSLEEFTYCDLVERICSKITVDKSTTKLKLSYIPLQVVRKRHTYILDDEDLLGYLLEGDNKISHHRDVLHVEVIKQGGDLEITREEIIPREDLESGIHISNGCEEFGNVDNEDLFIDVETNDVENLEWEDGLGLTIGQEFESKRQVQDLVDKAVLRNQFEVIIKKSEPTIYALKCRGSCCKWSLRVATGKKSDRLSVTTYNKIHTCARVTTSTRRSKKTYSPRLLASVLNEDFPGEVDSLTPKSIMSFVQDKYGASVSYSTAIRGKKLATSDVHASPAES